MKGEDKKLIRFFEGADKRFIIPLYQRNYDWEIKHCRQLFSDLVVSKLPKAVRCKYQ